MILLLCILLGLVLGQQVKFTVNPELQAFMTRTWAIAIEQAPAIKASTAAAAQRLKASASKTLKASTKPALSGGKVT
jgi:hypothetical protein